MPSMVVTAPSPTADTGSEQDRTGTSPISTVQAPQNAAPQPNLVPKSPSSSRSTQSSGVSPSTSTGRVAPLMRRVSFTSLS